MPGHSGSLLWGIWNVGWPLLFILIGYLITTNIMTEVFNIILIVTESTWKTFVFSIFSLLMWLMLVSMLEGSTGQCMWQVTHSLNFPSMLFAAMCATQLKVNN